MTTYIRGFRSEFYWIFILQVLFCISRNTTTCSSRQPTRSARAQIAVDRYELDDIARLATFSR
jgi:hypothetical protein